MPNVMLGDDKIQSCIHCKQRYVDYPGIDRNRTHRCVCHFCAKPFEMHVSTRPKDVYLARCKVCEGFRDPANTDEVGFCGECARNRNISAAPRLADFNEQAVRKALRKPFYDLLRKKEKRKTAVKCPKDFRDKCCCDGERLILLLEDLVPAYGDVLKNEETVDKEKVYKTHTTRAHAHNVMRWYLNTYGEFVSSQWNAMILLLLCTRAVAWKLARAQGSPRSTPAIAHQLLRSNRALLESVYKHGKDCPTCANRDLTFDNQPYDVEALLTVAEAVLKDDPLRKYITGHHLKRRPDYEKDLAWDVDFRTGADITIEREHGKITLEEAVAVIRDMSAGLPPKIAAKYQPTQIYAILMSVFQIEMGCYDLETIRKETVTTSKFSLGNTYMDYRPSLYSFLWEDGRDKWRGVRTPEFGFRKEPDDLFKTLLALVSIPEDAPPEEAARNWKKVEDGDAGGRRLRIKDSDLARVRLSNQVYQLKPPGMDPINEKQYQVLRNFVKYDAEFPGSASYRKPADPPRMKLQNYLKAGAFVQEFDPYIEALSDIPCADEVMHFICRKLEARYQFPTAKAASPQELVDKILTYLLTAPITITFPLDNWFLASDPSSPNYPAKTWGPDGTLANSYKHAFQLESTQKPVDLGSLTGSNGKNRATTPPVTAAHVATASTAVSAEAEAALAAERERRALLAKATIYRKRAAAPRLDVSRLSVKDNRRLSLLNSDFNALKLEEQEWVTETYNRLGAGLRTYTAPADWAASRPDTYNRWRIDKDLRAAGFIQLSPSDFPAYGALNFDVELTGGWFGSEDRWPDRTPQCGYRYYGTGHFLLNPEVVARRATYELRHYYQPCRKSLLLLLGDILTKPLTQPLRRDDQEVFWAIDTVVGQAICANQLYAEKGHANAFSEVQVYGEIRFGAGKEADRLLLPEILTKQEFDAIAQGRLSAREYERLNTRIARAPRELTGQVKQRCNDAAGRMRNSRDQMMSKVQLYTADKKKIDRTKSMLASGVSLERYYSTVVVPQVVAAFAKDLGPEIFARAIGKLGPQCAANIADFCQGNNVEAIHFDVVSDDPPHPIVADGTQPLPKPDGSGRVDDTTRRSPRWWLFLDA